MEEGYEINSVHETEKPNRNFSQEERLEITRKNIIRVPEKRGVGGKGIEIK